MKTKSVILTALLLTAFCLQGAPTLVSDLASLKFDKQASGKAAWSQIYAVVLLHPQMPNAHQTMTLLNEMHQLYSSRNVKIYTLIPGQLDAVKKFAARYPASDFTICADSEMREAKNLLGSNFQPAHIFNYSGKLLWSGEVIDLPMMLKKVTAGKYSERDEIRISALVSSLQAALRSGDARMIGQSADQILELRPEQLSAVNAKAYALEMSRDHAGLEKFFRDRIKRFPQEKSNYFMLIEASFRNPGMNHIAPEIARLYFKNFPQDFAGINAIAWGLLNKLQFNIEAVKASDEAVKILNTAPNFHTNSRYLATASLTAYRQCKLRNAIMLADAAIKSATDPSEKAFLENLLQYYRSLLQNK